MQSIVVDAHGKINLTLDVLRRREDGYHDIKSVMQSIGIADRLIINKQNEGIELETNIHITTERKNLAWRAAELFFETMDLKAGVKIKLIKNLPLSAGLAGGSGNAAAVLWALNKLYKTDLSLSELQEIGASLGADIPFCLQGGTLLAEGIGDQLTKLPDLPQYYIVLVKPNQSVSTQRIYQSLTNDMFGERYSSGLIQRLRDNLDISAACGNVLQGVTSMMIAEIDLWQERMLHEGAKASIMSGSGPTVFGLFAEKTDAIQFCQKWKDRKRWIAWTTPVSTGLSQVKE